MHRWLPAYLLSLVIPALLTVGVLGGAVLERALPPGPVWSWLAWLVALVPIWAGLWLAGNYRRLTTRS